MKEKRERIGSPNVDPAMSYFFPIPARALRLDTLTNFDLYIRPDKSKPPVLYREHSLQFSEDVLEQLQHLQIEVLFVERNQESAFQDYVDSQIETILDDEAISPNVRSELAYQSAQGVVAGLFNSPQAGDLVSRVETTVTATMKFMLSEPTAIANLIQVMSFDYYTYTHSLNVFVFSIGLAHKLDCTDEIVLKELGEGAILHDIGKSFLPEELVTFPGVYSKEQFEQMRKHPVLGYDLLTEQGTMGDMALDVVRHHHEKLRGGGYPDDLKGDEISPSVRICTIADIFDAITTNRSYKRALPSFEALRLMKRECLPDLDSDYFRAFVELLRADSAE